MLPGRSLGGAGEGASSAWGAGDHAGGAVDETDDGGGGGGGGGGGYVAVVYTSAPALAGVYSEVHAETPNPIPTPNPNPDPNPNPNPNPNQAKAHSESSLREPSPLWRSLTALTKPPAGGGGGGRVLAGSTAGCSLAHDGATAPGQRAAAVLGAVESLDAQFAAWAARTTPPAQQAAPAAYAAPRERAERHAPAQRRLAFTSSS